MLTLSPHTVIRPEPGGAILFQQETAETALLDIEGLDTLYFLLEGDLREWPVFFVGYLQDREFVISAAEGTGLETLRNEIYRRMDVVRVYTKLPSAKEPDLDRPFTVRRGENLLTLAAQVHKDYAQGLKFARVWGTAVHDATMVKGDYVLHDKDIVELHM